MKWQNSGTVESLDSESELRIPDYGIQLCPSILRHSNSSTMHKMFDLFDVKFELKHPIRKFSKFGLLGLKIDLQIGFASVK